METVIEHDRLVNQKQAISLPFKDSLRLAVWREMRTDVRARQSSDKRLSMLEGEMDEACRRNGFESVSAVLAFSKVMGGMTPEMMWCEAWTKPSVESHFDHIRHLLESARYLIGNRVMKMSDLAIELLRLHNDLEKLEANDALIAAVASWGQVTSVAGAEWKIDFTNNPASVIQLTERSLI